MKRCRIFLLVFLVAALMMCDMQGVAFANPVMEGRSESQAIELRLGKEKNGVFRGGTESVYFCVLLNHPGKLKVTFSAKSMESDVRLLLYNKQENVPHWENEKNLKYKKSKKITSGVLTSEQVLPGSKYYYIKVTPKESIEAGQKFKLTVKLMEEELDDQAPNNTEETAQTMKVQTSDGKPVTYKMLLSSIPELEDEDAADCFSFKLKEDKELRVRLIQKNEIGSFQIFLQKKTAQGYETVKRYDVLSGKFDQKVSLKKGTYCLKVVLNDNNKRQVLYTISASVIERVAKVTIKNKGGITLWTDSSKGKSTVQLKADVSPKNASNKKLRWTTDNKKVVKVSETGKVTALKAGTATVRVTAQDGSNKSAVCKITVKEPEPEKPKPDSGSDSGSGSGTDSGSSSETEPAPAAPKIEGPGKRIVYVDQEIVFRVSNGVAGGEWKLSKSSILKIISSSGTSCKMRGLKAGTVTVYYVVNGKRMDQVRVSVRG